MSLAERVTYFEGNPMLHTDSDFLSAIAAQPAGNYGGRLGKSFIYLHPEKQPA